MAKGDWWFKFEYLKWLTDEQLNRCSLETQGFWMRCICVMRKSDVAKLHGTQNELCRLLSVTPSEFKRCFSELLLTKTATVTQTAKIFTLMSRKFAKELKVKEQNRLRKQRERRHADVADVSHDRVRSKSKSKKEEEKREASAPPTAHSKSHHPAIVAMQEVTGILPARDQWDEIIDRVGVDVDIGKLKEVFRKWRARGYTKTNYDGIIDWYTSGIPKAGAKNGAGSKFSNGHKPTPGEVIANRPYRNAGANSD